MSLFDGVCYRIVKIVQKIPQNVRSSLFLRFVNVQYSGVGIYCQWLALIFLVLKDGLSKNFSNVDIEVVDCPDLRESPWTLAAPGKYIKVATQINIKILKKISCRNDINITFNIILNLFKGAVS